MLAVTDNPLIIINVPVNGLGIKSTMDFRALDVQGTTISSLTSIRVFVFGASEN